MTDIRAFDIEDGKPKRVSLQYIERDDGKKVKALANVVVNESGVAQSAGTATDPVHVLTPQSKIVSPTITVATTPYAAGDCVGGKLTLTDAVRVSEGTGVLQSISVIDSSNIKPALEIVIFNADPSAATLTDNAEIAFSTDVSKISHRISIYSNNYTTVGGVAIASVNPGMVVQAVGSANLYACIMAVAAHEFVAVSDLQVKFGFIY
jgi:hypothetical protein